jgi:hypothetical protein
VILLIQVEEISKAVPKKVSASGNIQEVSREAQELLFKVPEAKILTDRP